MSNIVEQVTPDYFSGRFAGCMFFGPTGNPCYIEAVNNQRRGVVNCKEFLSAKDSKQTQVPFEFFQSFNFLAVPELGWRAAESGRVLVRLQRNNSSYTRGITTKNVMREYAPHTEYMISMNKLKRAELDTPGYLVMLVTKPNHLTMAEGLEKLNRGAIMAFTNSAKVAVVPESNNSYNLFCNADHVANVTPEGEVRVLAGCEDFDPETLQ